MPPIPKNSEEGIIKGIYKFKKVAKPVLRLIGSGSIMQQVISADKILSKIPEIVNLSVKINKIANGEIMMMENVRFNKGEETNDNKFSEKISNLGDIYVNDAFSCSHRFHPTVEGITKYITT